tara:strand:+ start:288 stop:419 length:132 start_codon:yes stop_codon:yes gene_type:complete
MDNLEAETIKKFYKLASISLKSLLPTKKFWLSFLPLANAVFLT